MGKHEPMTAKAIANRIKAKGLQKIKYYCEMCKKQCRDANGFKCHIQSDVHQRQALIVSEDTEKFVNEYSRQFMEGFMYILKARYRSKRVLANTVFQEYIKERDHVHMNGTRWTSLSEFATWMGQEGIVTVDESERGIMITYINRDPETLRRQQLDAKRAEQAKEAAKRAQEDIQRHMEAAKRIYKQTEGEKDEAKPVPVIKIAVTKVEGKSDGETLHTIDESIEECKYVDVEQTTLPSTSNHVQPTSKDDSTSESFIERPVFKVQPMSLKTAAPSAYKPPPPKRKVVTKGSGTKKKIKS